MTYFISQSTYAVVCGALTEEPAQRRVRQEAEAEKSKQ